MSSFSFLVFYVFRVPFFWQGAHIELLAPVTAVAFLGSRTLPPVVDDIVQAAEREVLESGAEPPIIFIKHTENNQTVTAAVSERARHCRL